MKNCPPVAAAASRKAKDLSQSTFVVCAPWNPSMSVVSLAALTLFV